MLDVRWDTVKRRAHQASRPMEWDGMVKAAGQTVVITGAAGRIGAMLRTRLPAADRVLRVVDLVPCEGGQVVDVTDLDALRAVVRGAHAIVHLAGHGLEMPWRDILETNVQGTWCVLESARLEGVPRVVLASSNQIAGMRPTPSPGDEPLPADCPPRPGTYYGWSKAAMESLGSLFHDRFGLDVICLRIGSCFSAPPGDRGLSTWLSPDDAGRLVDAALRAPAPGFVHAWGVSANTRGIWSMTEGRELGYQPTDDAESWASALPPAEPPAPGFSAAAAQAVLGGPLALAPVGQPQTLRDGYDD